MTVSFKDVFPLKKKNLQDSFWNRKHTHENQGDLSGRMCSLQSALNNCSHEGQNLSAALEPQGWPGEQEEQLE